jgi:hypothetical protein
VPAISGGASSRKLHVQNADTAVAVDDDDQVVELGLGLLGRDLRRQFQRPQRFARPDVGARPFQRPPH